MIELTCKTNPLVKVTVHRTTCPSCGELRLHENHLPEGVELDLDGEPYRDGDIGPWKVSECCFAYAKGTDWGVVCRRCHEPTYHFDAPANLPATEDRFGRNIP